MLTLAKAHCTFLSDAHPHARDVHITFEASTHVYQIMRRPSLGRLYVAAVVSKVHVLGVSLPLMHMCQVDRLHALNIRL
jgi:hypothetical protein